MKLLTPLAFAALLTACPSGDVVKPVTPATLPVPAPIASWFDCARTADFHIDQIVVAEGGSVTARVVPPSVSVVAALTADAEDATSRDTLRWLTPIPSGTWRIAMRPAADGVQLDAFDAPAFADAQRVLWLQRRCGELVMGETMRELFSTGKGTKITTVAATRLVLDRCVRGGDCPSKWRRRLLKVARQWRRVAGPARPSFASTCAQQAPPDGAAPAAIARTLEQWIRSLDPPSEGGFLKWVRSLKLAGLASGEDLVARRFRALQSAGAHRDAAAFIDAAAKAFDLSEALRYDAARAYLEAGAKDEAKARLTALADSGVTVYAEFARDDLASL